MQLRSFTLAALAAAACATSAPALAAKPIAADANGLANPTAPIVPAAPASPEVLVPAAAEPAEPKVLARAINLAAQQKMPESFGAPKQVVVGGSSRFNIYGVHQQLHGQNKVNAFALSFEPWVGVFALRHFLIGGILPIAYSRAAGAQIASIGVGPLLAWHVPVSTHFGLLPRIGVTYQYARSATYGQAVNTHVDGHNVTLSARIEGIVHLTHHLSANVGPYVTQSLLNRSGGAKAPWRTTYGGQVGLLGWF